MNPEKNLTSTQILDFLTQWPRNPLQPNVLGLLAILLTLRMGEAHL